MLVRSIAKGLPPDGERFESIGFEAEISETDFLESLPSDPKIKYQMMMELAYSLVQLSMVTHGVVSKDVATQRIKRAKRWRTNHQSNDLHPPIQLPSLEE